MTKRLYSKEDVEKLSSLMWKYAALCIALVVIAVNVSVIFCFFVTDDNANMLKNINIILCSVFGCVALYFLFNGVTPVRAKKNYVEKMLNSPCKKVRGRVIDNGKDITAVKHITLSEIRLTDENGKERILYWDKQIALPEFASHFVELEVVNNKIVGYGDVQ